MTYDFETARRRTDMGAEKWEIMKRTVGEVPDDLVPLSIADMEFLDAPCITQALHQAVEFGEYGYTVAHDRFDRAVCDWFQKHHGWEIQSQWLTQTYGVVAAMGFAIQAFSQPGDGIIYQPPVYGPFKRSIELAGRIPLANPLKLVDGHYELDFDGLEKLCAAPKTSMLLLCSPHNPVGRVWQKEELQRLSAICLRYQVLIFADEIHCDFVYQPHIHTPLATLSAEQANHCVSAVSTSKTFNLAGLSTANIVIANETLREQFRATMYRNSGQFINYFGVAATTAAYEGGASWLEELKEVLIENYQYCKEFLAQKFPSVKVYPLEGTYLMWADFRSFGLEPAALEEFMTNRAGLHLDEGYIFGDEGKGFERINLACPKRYLVAAMERLDRAAVEAGLPR